MLNHTHDERARMCLENSSWSRANIGPKHPVNVVLHNVDLVMAFTICCFRDVA